MPFDVGIFLAALGITTLEFVEASAVGLALYGDTHRRAAFLYVASGSIAVLVPTFILGDLISLLPIVLVRLVGGVLLLYFGLRLTRSARRSVLTTRRARAGQNTGGPGHSQELAEKGLMSTAFSVGAIEAFEAAIVIVGLLPNSYGSTIFGFALGIVVVCIGTYLLRNQVRKLKQASMKEVVSALLLSFSVFWFSEVFTSTNDLFLIPLFVIFFLIVHSIANRGASKIIESAKLSV